MNKTIYIGADPSQAWSNLETSVFDAKFRQNYYEVPRLLSGVFEEYPGINGKYFSIPSVSATEMKERTTYYSDVDRETPALGKSVVTLADYAREFPVDRLLDANSGSKGQILAGYAKVVAEALKTTEDFSILKALAAGLTITSSGSSEINQKETTEKNAVSLEEILDISIYLDNNGVPNAEKFAIAPMSLKNQILLLDKATSYQYVEVKALTTGIFNDYLGYAWRWLPDTYFTAHKIPSGIFLLHKTSGAQCWGTQSGTTVYYENKCLCNIINAVLQVGAGLALPQGVVFLKLRTA